MTADSARGGMRAALRLPTLRWLSAGNAASLLGDELYLIALPWLVLDLTGSGAALGLVLTAAAVPRALVILGGGALSDRFGPRAMMQVSSAASAAASGVVAGLLAFGALESWHLFAAAILLGAIDGVFYPAANAIVPRIVPRERLAAANALQALTTQTVGFLGPGLAGVIVAASPGAAFGASAGLSVLSVLLLARVRPGASPAGTPAAFPAEHAAAAGTAGPRGLVAGFVAGLRVVWSDPAMRGLTVLLAVLNLALIGPYVVGGGLLAAERFGGAAAFGLILSGFGGGGLAGTLIAGAAGEIRRLGWLVLGTAAVLGVGTIMMGLVTNLVVAVGLAAVMGVALGLEEVRMLTWFQMAAPPGMQGRVMAAAGFAAEGMEPVSYVLAGWLGASNPGLPFVLGGAVTLVATVLIGVNRSVRNLR